MATQLHITQLRPGMRIEKLDRSWFETPFFSQCMAVTSMEQVEQLKACGVETLDDTPASADAILEPAAPSATPSVAGSSPDTPTNSFEEESPAAKLVYTAAKNVIEQAMLDVRIGRTLNMDAVNQVVSEMADSVLRNPDALTSLSRMKHFDEYTFFHSVNTSLLALSLGRNLNPAGSIVQLNTGEVAVVSRINRHAPLEPVIIAIKGSGNTLLSHPETIDLAQPEQSQRRSILAVTDPVSTGIHSTTYLDQELS
jgi:hypothetical protein